MPVAAVGISAKEAEPQYLRLAFVCQCGARPGFRIPTRERDLALTQPSTVEKLSFQCRCRRFNTLIALHYQNARVTFDTRVDTR